MSETYGEYQTDTQSEGNKDNFLLSQKEKNTANNIINENKLLTIPYFITATNKAQNETNNNIDNTTNNII